MDLNILHALSDAAHNWCRQNDVTNRTKTDDENFFQGAKIGFGVLSILNEQGFQLACLIRAHFSRKNKTQLLSAKCSVETLDLFF